MAWTKSFEQKSSSDFLHINDFGTRDYNVSKSLRWIKINLKQSNNHQWCSCEKNHIKRPTSHITTSCSYYQVPGIYHDKFQLDCLKKKKKRRRKIEKWYDVFGCNFSESSKFAHVAVNPKSRKIVIAFSWRGCSELGQ